jgi:hypothetical protein
MNCTMCLANGQHRTPAVAMCQQLHVSVCERHAASCRENGHEAAPLPAEQRQQIISDAEEATLP